MNSLVSQVVFNTSQFVIMMGSWTAHVAHLTVWCVHRFLDSLLPPLIFALLKWASPCWHRTKRTTDVKCEKVCLQLCSSKWLKLAWTLSAVRCMFVSGDMYCSSSMLLNSSPWALSGSMGKKVAVSSGTEAYKSWSLWSLLPVASWTGHEEQCTQTRQDEETWRAGERFHRWGPAGTHGERVFVL